MGADFQGLAFKGLKSTWRYAKILTLNSLRRGLILGRYILGVWQQRRINKSMGRLGVQFFQALARGETNPLVASEVSDAVQKAKDLKEVKDKNSQALAAIRDRIRAAWVQEPPPPPPAPSREKAGEAENPEEPLKPQEPPAE